VGARKCEANAVVTCGDTDGDGCLDWANASPCGDDVCVSGFCQSACANECTTPNARKCDGNGYTTCADANGDGCLEWGTVVACQPTEACSSGFCASTCSNECTSAGAKKCDQNSVITCGDANDDGCLEWGSPLPCDQGLVCSSGTCAAVCVSECSIEGAKKCTEAGTVTACEDADGQGCLKWGTPSACEPPLVCSQGACALACDDECAGVGLKQCAEGAATKYQVCDEWDGDGCLEWGTPVACADGLVCSGAQCVTSCDDECPTDGQKACDGNAWHQCGDWDADGCLEWGTSSYCSATETCANGACAPTPPPATVLISELVYDSPGSPDDDAFVELYGPAGTDLTGFSVVGVDGSSGNDYNAIALTGVVIPVDGFFVIANPNAIASTVAAADLLSSKIDVQNGPDSVQLRWGATVVDALAYGTFAADDFPAGEGTPASKTSTPGHSLARDEAETDTNDNKSDFEDHVATPGAPNVVPNVAPVAQIQCPTGGKAGDLLAFSGAASSDSDGTLVTYAFDFGDGDDTSGGASSVQHAYADAGSYVVTLVVTDDDGATGQTTCNVSVESVAGNQPPTAVLACPDPATGKVGQVLSFDGSGSSDPDGMLVRWLFTFPDGTVDGNQPNATHSFAAAGTYDVTLQVTDDDGATASDACTLVITPASAPDKTISSNTELCGAQEYNKLTIQGGAKVTCATGAIDIRAAEVLVDPASSIDVSATSSEASGQSYNICGAACVCDYGYTGASGGGNGTKGGDSLSTAGDARSPEMGGCLGSCVQFGCSGRTGGYARGLASELDAPLGGMGGTGCDSGFSSCSTPWSGGKGGGSVRIVATKSITVQGQILANGATGATASDPAWIGAGGGAGGSIVLAAPSLALGTAHLSATGGAGGKGTKPSSYYTSNYAHGGDGGKGWIKLAHGPTSTTTGTFDGATLVESVLPPLSVTSSTHPDQALVYNDTFTDLDVAWTAPFPEVTGYWYGLSSGSSFVLSPANGTYTTGTSATFPAASLSPAGTWYVRVLAVDGAAVAGTIAARFDVHVNGTPHTVASSSHPNPNAWYTGTAVALSFTPPSGASADSFPAFWYRVDRNSTASPADAKTTWTRTTNPQVVVTTDAAGQPLSSFAYTFHLVAEDTRGNLTKQAAHFRFQLGTEPAKVTFFGYVKDGGGAAVQGAKVHLEPYGLEQTTDANGYFLLSNVYEGAYTLTVTKAGFADLSTAVTVNAGASPYTATVAP
jgi:PKD repeat protein